jgi:hypothetical protein
LWQVDKATIENFAPPQNSLSFEDPSYELKTSINTENISQISQLSQFGLGSREHISVHPIGKVEAISGGTGVWLVDTETGASDER